MVGLGKVLEFGSYLPTGCKPAAPTNKLHFLHCQPQKWHIYCIECKQRINGDSDLNVSRVGALESAVTCPWHQPASSLSNNNMNQYKAHAVSHVPISLSDKGFVEPGALSFALLIYIPYLYLSHSLHYDLHTLQ